MIVKAENKHIKISPSKMREVMDLIRNKDVQEAEAILINLNKRPKESLIKVLRSAIANAKIKGFEPRQLYISKVICNVGPAWKRYKAAAFGRATPIKRRTSHIKIELDLKG
ncbi:MAG: 50S ribosomal protein L22 [Candidatus Omnitrophota bacterium]|nr:50S ribosomal protein L22 [Candidatus Omnitrophota bacterium]MBU2034198.1 50S ribosomal protein L22 [Candidatus Omnitrophota bacterium]MBU2257506.1 50S ribosomal protein L22 [Candidatus Omnitrophota bacterium]